MNKREAQQKLVAYKNEKREEQYELEHGILSNFKAKYLEKIPLGNGKFRYIYEEAKDKVKSAANSVSNLVKIGTANPGKMTANEKYARSSTNQARADVKSQQEYDAARAKEADLREKAAKRMGAPTLEEMRQTTAEIRAKQTDRYKKGVEAENKARASLAKSDLSYELKQMGAKNPTTKGATGSEMEKACENLLGRFAEQDKEFKSFADQIDNEKTDDDERSDASKKLIANRSLKMLDDFEGKYISKDGDGKVLDFDDLSLEQQYLANMIASKRKYYEDILKELTKNVQSIDRSKESAARKAANEAINKRTRDLAEENIKKISSDIDYSRNTSGIGKVSSEYLEELEYNSRKNK